MSKETISRITDKVIEEMQAWSTTPPNEVYAAIFIDAIMVKVGDGQVANRHRVLPDWGEGRPGPVGRYRR